MIVIYYCTHTQTRTDDNGGQKRHDNYTATGTERSHHLDETSRRHTKERQHVWKPTNI